MPKEYIDREVATEIIDNYAKTISKDCLVVYQAIRDIVDIICPAADVVEVVRCKDCLYWEKGKDYEPYCNHFGSMMTDTNPTDFCSYGKRQE